MNRRKYLAAIGSLAAGTAAASGTGAFTAATVGRNADMSVVNDDSAYLKLEAGGARGVGDRVGTENGDLYIDLDKDATGSGVNDQAKYQLGAMDDSAKGDEIEFGSIYDDDSNPSAAAPGTPLSNNGDDQSAFVVTNNSGQTLDIEIGLNTDSDNKGATVYLQGRATAISADGGGNPQGPSSVDSATATNTGVLDLDDPAEGQSDPKEALSFNNDNDPDEAIPAGASVYVSFQIDTTDSGTSGPIDLAEQLVINANEAADPGVE